MRKYLLPKNGNFYKANLHSHSTVSDGQLTPEQMKELYKGHGYQILALTDHYAFVPRNDLTDEDFLILNGFEVQIYDLTWSLERYPEYSGYKYMHAMEICNNGSLIGGFTEYNPPCLRRSSEARKQNILHRCRR